MANTEAQILSDTFQKVRDLTKWYSSLLKGVDPNKKWEVNGKALNSALWVTSHLTWAENFLLLKGIGGKELELPWLEHYNISSDGSIHDSNHQMKEVLDTLKTVHEKAMAHLKSMSDEDMDKENVLGFGFGGLKTNRILIQHAIRHEAMHTGHLSWLCKINGIDTV